MCYKLLPHGTFNEAYNTLQRWPESHFETLALFLFQNIWILFRNIFNFVILTPVQTPAIFAAIEIQQYLNLSNWQLYRGARSFKGASRNFEGGASPAMFYNMESFWTGMCLFKRYTSANFTLLLYTWFGFGWDGCRE